MSNLLINKIFEIILLQFFVSFRIIYLKPFNQLLFKLPIFSVRVGFCYRTRCIGKGTQLRYLPLVRVVNTRLSRRVKRADISYWELCMSVPLTIQGSIFFFFNLDWEKIIFTRHCLFSKLNSKYYDVTVLKCTQKRRNQCFYCIWLININGKHVLLCHGL